MRSISWESASCLAILAAFVVMAAGCTASPTAVPQPTETPTPAEASESAGVTEIILVADNTLGGLSSKQVTTTIDVESGAFTVESNEDGETREGNIGAEDLAALKTLVEDAGFFALQEDYIPEDGTCCDLVAYVITVMQDGAVHRVRASNENMPEAFRQLLGQLQALTGS